jgi:hypothetical protein
MRYMLLLYDNENSPPPDEAEMAAWFAVTEAMQKAGVYVGGEALHPTTSSTTDPLSTKAIDESSPRNRVRMSILVAPAVMELSMMSATAVSME